MTDARALARRLMQLYTLLPPTALVYRFPGVYTDANVAISGTHTHSGPSGFLQDTIFLFAGSGWVPTTINVT